ncbi:MAG: hypothetical protein LBB36_00860 [Fibromonadaceae bacterium]|jgi:hypothetical protein|nr:hypothetical protein [Fibromonadaceae bacterium]
MKITASSRIWSQEEIDKTMVSQFVPETADIFLQEKESSAASENDEPVHIKYPFCEHRVVLKGDSQNIKSFYEDYEDEFSIFRKFKESLGELNIIESAVFGFKNKTDWRIVRDFAFFAARVHSLIAKIDSYGFENGYWGHYEFDYHRDYPENDVIANANDVVSVARWLCCSGITQTDAEFVCKNLKHCSNMDTAEVKKTLDNYLKGNEIDEFTELECSISANGETETLSKICEELEKYADNLTFEERENVLNIDFQLFEKGTATEGWEFARNLADRIEKECRQKARLKFYGYKYGRLHTWGFYTGGKTKLAYINDEKTIRNWLSAGPKIGELNYVCNKLEHTRFYNRETILDPKTTEILQKLKKEYSNAGWLGTKKLLLNILEKGKFFVSSTAAWQHTMSDNEEDSDDDCLELDDLKISEYLPNSDISSLAGKKEPKLYFDIIRFFAGGTPFDGTHFYEKIILDIIKNKAFSAGYLDSFLQEMKENMLFDIVYGNDGKIHLRFWRYEDGNLHRLWFLMDACEKPKNIKLANLIAKEITREKWEILQKHRFTGEYNEYGLQLDGAIAVILQKM